MEKLRILRNLLDGASGMCLFFGILKNMWLLVYVRIRISFNSKKQNNPTYFAKIAETRCFNYVFLLSDLGEAVVCRCSSK